MSGLGKRVVLVTGASRGIGLGLVAELVADKNFTVLATCRNPNTATQLQKVLSEAAMPPAFSLDVTSDESVAQLANTLKEKNIVLTDLINNAGISTPDHPVEKVGSISRHAMLDVFNTNVAGVAAVTNASGILNTPGGKVINISSSMGSVAKTQQGQTANCPSYRCSKAALNMLTVCFASSYPDTVFGMVHPGWVQTDMGGAAGRTADINVQESAKGILEVLKGLERDQSGKFFDWQGNQLPW